MRSPDFTRPSVIADPFPVLRELRERDPVHWHSGLNSWCLTRYEHLVRAYRDLRFSSDRIRPFVARQRGADLEMLGECLGLWMVFNDPPTHTRLRKLTQKAFTRKNLQALRPVIEAQVKALIENLDGALGTDFVRSFAYPLPANVIADLLGVPREHVEDLKRWSDDLAQFVLTSRIQPDKYAVAARSLACMNELFQALIEQRRRHPGECVMDDLIAACDGDERLSRDELLAFCVLLLFAGHETTTHFFANGLRALLLHPAQMEDLRTHASDAGLVSNACNEMLRWDGPIVAISRHMAEPVEWQGKRLRRGERVYLFNAAANRDPHVFAEPERFDIRRPQAHKMIGFGFGIHLCLGIHLARLEGEVGFPLLLQRLKHMELASDAALEWADTLVIRGPKALPINFTLA